MYKSCTSCISVVQKLYKLYFSCISVVRFLFIFLVNIFIITLHRNREINAPSLRCRVFFVHPRSLAYALKHPRSLARALKHSRLGIAQASLALLSARRSLTSWNNHQNVIMFSLSFFIQLWLSNFHPLLSCEAMGGFFSQKLNVVIKEHDINIIYI